MASAGARAQAPANDNFANAQVLATGGGTLSGDNTRATVEAGETSFGVNTLWYLWTPTQSGRMQITIAAANNGTVRCVYTGSSFTTLSMVAFVWGGTGVPLVFDATAGTTYRIEIGASGAPTSTAFSLSWGPTSLTLPSITTQPSSVAASEGSTATMSVAGTGPGLLSYQWYWTPAGTSSLSPLASSATYGGTTTATLTISGVTAAMNGDRFMCRVDSSSVLPGVSSFSASLTVMTVASVITTQPRNTMVTAGQPATLSVAATGPGPFTYQWRRNGFPIIGATSSTYTIPSATRSDADYYDVLVGTVGSQLTSSAARLSVAPRAYPGNVAFDPTSAFSVEVDTTAYNAVARAIAVAPDGMFYLAGDFTSIDGTRRLRIARFNADGTLDSTFASPEINGTVNALAVQTDGRIVAGGWFTGVAGQAVNRLARFNTDGTLDAAFTAALGTGLNDVVRALLVLADGRIVAGGDFTTVNGQNRARLVRLSSAGMPDNAFAPAPDASVYALALQTDGKLLVGGVFSGIGGRGACGLARLNADGTADDTFNYSTGEISTVYTLMVDGTGRIYAGGYLITQNPTAIHSYARLTTTGALDPTFTAPAAFNGMVYAQLLLPGGKVLVGGELTPFTTFLARLNADGANDASYTQPKPNETVCALAAQPDGRILVGGQFTSIGSPRAGIARLNADMSLDDSFTVTARTAGAIRAVVPAPGGKLYVAGSFSRLNGLSARNLARLNADGTVDATFNLGTGPDGDVNRVALQGDGRLVMVGYFTAVNGTARRSVARLNPDGSLDGAFDPGSGPNAINSGTALVALPGGRVLLSGPFTTFNGQPRAGLVRLESDGSVDSGFNPAPNSSVYAALVQPDGRIVIGGAFATVGGAARSKLARLNADGTADLTFNPGTGPNNSVNTLALQPDGRLLVGGSFGAYNGTSRNYAARVNADGSLDGTFNPANVVNNAVWELLLQEDGRVLLRGTTLSFVMSKSIYTDTIARFNADGSLDGSFGFFPGPFGMSSTCAIQLNDAGQLWLGALNGYTNGLARLAPATTPVIATQPVNQTSTGGTVTFSVTATGMPAPTYQWIFNGNPLAGATNATLRLANVQPANMGTYSVTVANGLGAALSIAVTLTVVNAPPAIAVQPVNQTSLLGGTVTFSVTATGMPAPTYQWIFNGSPLAGATTASLALANVQSANIGTYSVTVTNAVGAVTSNPVTLNVPNSAPVIAVQPVGQTSLAGGTVTFSVVAAGLPTLTYQWNLNGSPLVGATHDALTLTNVQVANAGLYSVTVANGNGAVTSNLVTLNVTNGPPVIATQPQSATVTAGQPATLSVTAHGAGMLTYQWRRSGYPIAGATAATYGIGSASRSDAGSYDVMVGSGYGVSTSDTARLSVAPVAYPAKVAFDRSAAVVLEDGDTVRVERAVALPEGKFLIAGDFTSVDGVRRLRLARFNADGTHDATFTPPEINDTVLDTAVLDGGKILIGGRFSFVGGQTRQGLAWLNADGTLDPGHNPVSSDGSVNAIEVQADGKVLIIGNFTTMLGQARKGIARLNSDGTLDAGFVCPTANATIECLAAQSDGKIVIGGGFTTVGALSRYRIARLNSNGTLDIAFDPNANDTVSALVVQPDGRILVGGWFSAIGGQTRNYIARLNPNGSLDGAFNPNASGIVQSVAVRSDGGILVGGYFGMMGGQVRNFIARVNADGTLDAGFNPGANSVVNSIALTSDGKILAAGFFTSIGGLPRNCIARLNADGTPSPAVAPTLRAAGQVKAFAHAPGGKVYVGGQFTHVNGGTIGSHLARFNADGTLDNAFNPAPNMSVWALAVQGDGKLLVGGAFGFIGGQSRHLIARLNADGTADAGFNPNANDYVYALTVQPDGKIVLGGFFTTVGGQSRNHLARVNADGTLDAGFNPNVSGYSVYAVAAQSDGKVAFGGTFNSVGGQSRNFLARVNADGTLDAGFNPNVVGSSVSALSIDGDRRLLVGGNFTSVGGQPRRKIARLHVDGTNDTLFNTTTDLGWADVYALLPQEDGRILAGGNFSSLAGAAQVARLNADGTLDTGFQYAAGGGSFHQVYALLLSDTGQLWIGGSDDYGYSLARLVAAVAPAIATQPLSGTAASGSAVTFSVGVTGSTPLGFQWYFNGAPITGATSASYSIPSVADADAGTYTVTVANSLGAVTSSAAVLTVQVFPAITSQPAAQTVNEGATVTFAVTATGTPPPVFRWRKNGGLISGATSATLTLVNVQLADAGSYLVWVNNAAGSVLSSPVTLTVNPTTAPIITTQPTRQRVTAGENVSFAVVAGGTAPFSYQWRKEGTSLPGATFASFALASVQSSDAGAYSVVVTNSTGTAISSDALLEVIPAGFTITHAAGSGYFAGSPLQVATTITYASAFSSLGYQVLLPAGWSYVSGSGTEGDTSPAAGTVALLEWEWTTVPASPVTFSYVVNVPAGTTGPQSLAGLVSIRPGPLLFTAQPDPLVVNQITNHDADTDRNLRIRLLELTRVIELYNTRHGTTRTGCYIVATTTSEDGFAIDSTRAGTASVTLARHHSADSGRNGRIGLVELTRVIELYNTRSGTTRTGSYHVQTGSEDGFAPGP